MKLPSRSLPPTIRRAQLALILVALFGAQSESVAQEVRAEGERPAKENDEEAELTKDFERILELRWGSLM